MTQFQCRECELVFIVIIRKGELVIIGLDVARFCPRCGAPFPKVFYEGDSA